MKVTILAKFVFILYDQRIYGGRSGGAGNDLFQLCTRCDTLSREKGMKDVYVNFATNEVRFHMPENEVSVRDIVNGIQELGYQVVQQDMAKPKR